MLDRVNRLKVRSKNWLGNHNEETRKLLGQAAGQKCSVQALRLEMQDYP